MDKYVLFGDYSVLTSCEHVLSLVGHCFEPTPTKHPVIVFEGEPELTGEEPDGARIYSYPDHAGEVSALLGIELAALPDGSSNGFPAGFVVDRYSGHVPESVTATQVRLWLVDHGVSLDAVSAAITDDRARVYWEYAPYIERSNPLVDAIGGSLGLSSDQIDQAFREASLL
jgi:hypothetical protein